MDFDTRIKACKEIFELILDEYKLDSDLTNKINDFIIKYKDSNNESLWPFISTAFLMSQEFITTEKSYNFLKNSVVEIEDYFIDDDGFENICFLDKYSNNFRWFKDYLNVIRPEKLYVEDLFVNGDIDDKKCDYFIKNCSVSIEEVEDFFISNNFNLNGRKITNIVTDFKDILKQLCDSEYGYNSEFIKNDNEIDIIKLIVCIRNSLAHSNYEILSNEKIRLYSTEKKYNFIIDIKLLLVIIDEISEYHHNYALWYEKNDNDIKLKNKYYVSNEDLYNIIKSFDIDDLSAKKLLDEFLSKFKPNIKRRSVKSCKEGIFSFILDKYNSSSYYGIIINNYLYSNKGHNIDGELYRKSPLYNYLLDENYEKYDSKGYKTDRLKYYLLALINAYYHSTFNTLETFDSLKQFLPLDLSFIKLDQKTKDNFDLEYDKFIKENELSLREKLEKYNKLINEQKNKITKYEYDLENSKNQKYKDKIPSLILFINNTLNTLEVEKVQIEIELEMIKNKKNFINYKILKYIRHALSHGDVHFVGEFDFDNVGNNIIVFESFETNPSKKSYKSFYGSCKVNDFLNSIIDKDNIKTLLKIEKYKVNTKNR